MKGMNMRKGLSLILPVVLLGIGLGMAQTLSDKSPIKNDRSCLKESESKTTLSLCSCNLLKCL